MNKILNLFKVSFFVEIVITLVAVCVFLVYGFFGKKGDESVFTILFIYLSALSSLIIALKLAIATGKGARLSDELKIVGHIANAVRLLFVLLLLVGGIYFFVWTFKIVSTGKRESFLYYASMILFLLWSLASLYNFAAYIIIAKANKKATVTALYDFW